MKRNFLMKAFVCLFTVVALCSCSKDEDEKKDEQKSAACEIVSFVVNDTVWNIDGTNIAYEYSSDTPETLLTPTITLSPGATVNPPTTEAKNFFTEQGVTYTVTAEDGETTKTYTAKATVKIDDKYSVVPLTFTVTVEDGASFNDIIDTVKAETYSKYNDYSITLAKVPYANGVFTITLPESINAQYLANVYDEYEYERERGITVSNTDVKTVWMGLDAYKSDSSVGFFYYATTTDRECEGDFIYSDGDVSITGSYTEESINNDGVLYTYTDIYNVHLKKGWNIIYSKETDDEENRLYVSETTTQTPDGMKWFGYLDIWKYGDDVSGSLLKPKTLLSAKRTFGLK